MFFMPYLARPAYRFFSFLLALLLLAQVGVAGFARAAEPGWLEICSAGGAKYVPAEPSSGAAKHGQDAHCAACPVWQATAPPAPQALPIQPAAFAGLAGACPAPLPRAAAHWPPQLARGPPLRT
ncbi:hypothetical protein B0920_21125 [Massilia sp. KIM]|nr:hypothetical protein B0920_21125 [Massilia sp. KIM]